MQQSGRNKGKKYKKLTGDEIATPQDLARGAHFINWYGSIYKISKRMRDLDKDVAIDTIIQIYDDIVYKQAQVRNYKTYFLTAYRMLKIKRAYQDIRDAERSMSIEESLESTTSEHESGQPIVAYCLADKLVVDDFDVSAYEACANELHNEMLEHVRNNYAPREVSIYEIYIGLYPEASYIEMGAMLGISHQLIYTIVSAIKRDLRNKYAEKRKVLLSML
jgi:hypothetical protein